MTIYPDGIRRMDDFIGQKVRLLTDCQTRNGVKFTKGEIGQVKGHHRGRLNVAFSGKRLIRSLDRMAVALADVGQWNFSPARADYEIFRRQHTPSALRRTFYE